MEVMDMSLDKFYETVYKQGRTIPEAVLGKIAFAVSFLGYKAKHITYFFSLEPGAALYATLQTLLVTHWKSLM